VKRLACLIAATAAVSAAGAGVDPLWTLAQQRAPAARPWVEMTDRALRPPAALLPTEAR